MAITLENIPSGVVGKATIGSLIVLARAVTLALARIRSQQVRGASFYRTFSNIVLVLQIEAGIFSNIVGNV